MEGLLRGSGRKGIDALFTNECIVFESRKARNSAEDAKAVVVRFDGKLKTIAPKI